MSDVITVAHGSGGSETKKLIDGIFAPAFANETLLAMEDSAVVKGSEKIAVTTDSFVVTPLEYRGGDIGRLCVCGTVNDLLMRGAIPRYLTCGFILESGLEIDLLKRVVQSLADTAKEAHINIVAGDTKVIDGKGGLYINTAGVGLIPDGAPDIAAANTEEGDVIIVSGTMGDHHCTILSHRLNIESDIQSDNAPLVEMTEKLLNSGIPIHTMRDVTRGGLGTVLKELAESSGKTFYIDEESIPVSEAVKDFAKLMGTDVMYMGNEGKMVLTLPAEYSDKALELIKSSRYGENAAVIGEVKNEEQRNKKLIMRTMLGGERSLDILRGEGLPRIC